MDDNHILITFSVGEKQKEHIRHLFEGISVSFLAGMSSGQREKTLAQAEVLLSWYLSAELHPEEFNLLRNVRLIQLLSAGADQMPFARLPAEIVIASNVGVYAKPIAEHVLAMTLALAKNLLPEHHKMARGEFDASRLNRRLHGSLCGIIGFGGIGRAVARLMRPLGVRIHALNRSGRTEEPVEFIGKLDDLQKVLSMSDIVVLCIPLTRATRQLIGKQQLQWMKPEALLINVARGDIIVESDLYAHLAGHPDFRAGIDTWWIEPYTFGEFRTNYPFFSLSNVLGSPHNSGMVPGMKEEATGLAVQNVKRFLKGERVVGVVNREDYVEASAARDGT